MEFREIAFSRPEAQHSTLYNYFLFHCRDGRPLDDPLRVTIPFSQFPFFVFRVFTCWTGHQTLDPVSQKDRLNENQELLSGLFISLLAPLRPVRLLFRLHLPKGLLRTLRGRLT